MKTNITLKLDRDLLLLAEQLERAVRERDGYEQAKKRALARMKHASHLGYTPPASRDEFYER